ncbi:efflux RND transporter periplasmic adaptor subunit [Aureimonas jatrophae]|nr:efflux RND transporter periplasmic adaptor subunit [Aureimonas jatrophae]
MHQNHPIRTLPSRRPRLRPIVGVLGLVSSCLASPLAAQMPEGAQSISVVVARTGEVVQTVRATGTVVPRDAIMLRADLDGLRLTAVEVEAGDLVRAGDVLARLDDTMMRADERELSARLLRTEGTINQARNGLEDAEIALAQAESDMRRGGSLQKRGFTSSQAAETLETALKRAGAARAIAAQTLQLAVIDRQVIEAEAARLATRLEKTLVRAPVAGRVQKRGATVGMLVASAGEPLFILSENAVLEVEVELAERDFALVRVGQGVELRISGQNAPVRGTVRLVLPELTEVTRLGRARIALSATAGLPAGAFVRGEVEVSRHQGVVVPASAVSIDGAVSSLWQEREGVVERVRVKTGARVGDVVHVTSGLAEDTHVVLKAGSLLTEGDRIAPVEVAYDIPSQPSPTLQSARADR